MAERKGLLDFVAGTGGATQIAIRLIDFNPHQPRKYFNPAKMQALEESIKALGIRQPVLVQPRGGRYFLVCGERRVRAARAIGMLEVPAILLEQNLDDHRLNQIALIENLQREELNPLEETEGVVAFLCLKLGFTRNELESKFHRILNEEKGLVSTTEVRDSTLGQLLLTLFRQTTDISFEHFVKNRMKLLRLSSDVASRIRGGEISYTSAMEISKLPKEKREDVFDQAIAEKWGLEKVKSVVKELRDNPSKKENELKHRFLDLSTRLKRSNLWQDSQKYSKLEQILEELEGLLNAN